MLGEGTPGGGRFDHPWHWHASTSVPSSPSPLPPRRPPQALPAWLRYLLAYANFFSLLLLLGGVLCLVAFGLDRSDQSNLYLGIVLVLVVVLSSTFTFVQVGRLGRGCLLPARPRSASLPQLGASLPAAGRRSSSLSSVARARPLPPQEEKAHSLMQGFKDMVPRKCRAIREGAELVLDAWELVPGDVVQVG